MSWIDTLLPASIAGEPILVDAGYGGSAGRRIQVTNYPFSDRFSVEDMGQINEPFSLRAFILDNDGDLHERHDRILRALNSGELTLVHPRLGTVRVLPGQCSYTFLGARIRYNLQFAPPEQAPVFERVETSEQVSAACDKAITSANQSAAAAIKTDSHSSLFDSVQAGANSALESIQTANAAIDAAVAPVAELSLTIGQIGAELSTLIAQPILLFGAAQGLYHDVLETAESVDAALERYRKFKPDVATANTSNTPTAAQRATNTAALDKALNVAALAETLRFVSAASSALDVTSNADSPFDSYQHATGIRDELINDIDALLESADGATFDALSELRSTFYRHIDAHGMRLPRVQTRSFGVPLPAWVIAHDVHGDALRMNDLIRRNHIAAPLAVPADTQLEVLINE